MSAMASQISGVSIIWGGGVNEIFLSNFEAHFLINGRGPDMCCEISLRWLSSEFTDNKSKFGLGNGLVTSDNKPLPETMVTQM